MPESLEAVLMSATQSALETTAFIFAEPGAPDADACVDASAPFAATVTFTGAHTGAFAIEFPARLLPVLAMNVLGEEEVPGDDMQRDALGELANIICGNVLPALDADGAYSLGPPTVTCGAPAIAGGDSVRVALGALQVEGEPVNASLWLTAPGSRDRAA